MREKHRAPVSPDVIHINVIHIIEIMNSDNLPDQIVDSVYSPELNEVGIEITEIGFDCLLDDGVLKDLPVIGTIIKSIKGFVDIRDHIFIAKVAKFLFALKDTPLHHRESFKQRIHDDPKLKKKIGGTLVLLLDRLDDLEKPDILAKCFRSYLGEKTSFDDFRRLGAAIDIAFIGDLRKLYLDSNENQQVLANLVRTGLVDFMASGIKATWNDMGKIIYELSSIGRLFTKIMKEHSD
jgi:hypothetical protein